MTEKYLGEEIIPALRAKFDAKLDTATYDGELDQLVAFLDTTLSTGGWPLAWTQRLVQGYAVGYECIGGNTNNQTVTLPTDPTSSYMYPSIQLARLLNSTNTKGSSFPLTNDLSASGKYLNYRRYAADGTTLLDSAWQVMDPSAFVTISNNQYIEIQVGGKNGVSAVLDCGVAPYWTPGLVPQFDSLKYYNVSTGSDGASIAFPDPVYQTAYINMGGYSTGSNFYFRMRFKVDASACTNAGGLMSIFGVIRGIERTSSNAYMNGFGMAIRII